MDPTDFLATEPTAAAVAFERAAALAWRNQPLAAFSGRRLIAAQACGLRIFKLAAAEGESLGAYDGIFWDAVITIYLCLGPVSDTLLAVRRPELVAEKALVWAEKQRLSPASPDFAELLALFGRIMEDIMASSTEPVATGDEESEKKTTPTASIGLSSLPSRSGTSPAAPHPTS